MDEKVKLEVYIARPPTTKCREVVAVMEETMRRFDFPSCVDCDLRDTCGIAAANDGCWGWCPRSMMPPGGAAFH
jgi:hypothetical protein